MTKKKIKRYETREKSNDLTALYYFKTLPRLFCMITYCADFIATLMPKDRTTIMTARLIMVIDIMGITRHSQSHRWYFRQCRHYRSYWGMSPFIASKSKPTEGETSATFSCVQKRIAFDGKRNKVSREWCAGRKCQTRKMSDSRAQSGSSRQRKARRGAPPAHVFPIAFIRIVVALSVGFVAIWYSSLDAHPIWYAKRCAPSLNRIISKR